MPPKGYKLTSEQRKHISIARKKSKKARASARRNAIIARSRITKAARKQQAAKLRGRKYSKEHRRAISIGTTRYRRNNPDKTSKSAKLVWKRHRKLMLEATLPNILKAAHTPKTPQQLAAVRELARKYGHLGRAAMRRRPSKIQVRFSSILRKIIKGLRFDDYPIKANGHIYKPDIVNPRTKSIIEVDGEYWHSLPYVRKLDRTRDRNLKKAGWKILRLPASKVLFKEATIALSVAFLKAFEP